MDEDAPRAGRRWFALILLGILLHAGALLNSDLGLDAHVRLQAINAPEGDAQVLPWGKLRVVDETTQGPNRSASYDGYIPPWSTSVSGMKLTSLFALLAVATLSACVPRWEKNRKSFEGLWPVLALVSPVFLFATGRGYDEPVIALMVGVGSAGFYFNRGDEPHELRMHVLFLATSLLLVMGWKGFSMHSAVGVWLLAVLLGAAWMELERRQREGQQATWLSHPWFMGGAVAVGVYFTTFFLGLFFETGTLSIVCQSPGNFLLASLLAVLDAFGIYLLIGFAFWPFVASSFEHFRSLRGPGITLLVMFCSGLLTGMVCYIAALWTLESALWDLSLLETALLLGNNGRYATCLFLPAVLLLGWERPSSAAQSVSKKSLALAVCLLLPAVLFTSLHGQQHWSEDAGEGLAEALVEGDSSLLLVAPDALAMHHLYVLRTHVDLDGSLGLDGYWRTSGEAAAFLEASSTEADLVVVAPNAGFNPDEQQWLLVAEERAPVTVTGWAEGSWRIYRNVG